MAWPSARYKTAAVGGSWIPGDMNGVQDQYVRAAGIVADDLAEASVTDILGLTTTASGHGGAQVRRGKSIIATEQSRTNTSFGPMATDDAVLGVVLPTDGLIVVNYHALWKESVAAKAVAAIFIGGQQLKRSAANGPPLTPTAEASTSSGGTVNTYTTLSSYEGGLISSSAASASTGGITTGQLVTNNSGIGGPAYIFAEAGEYGVSVSFKALSGATVTVKERKLWVWTIGF